MRRVISLKSSAEVIVAILNTCWVENLLSHIPKLCVIFHIVETKEAKF